MYFLIGIFLVLYLEFLGQSFLSLIGKKRSGFSFGTGFCLLLSIAYILTSILTALNCSFYVVYAIYVAVFVSGLVLIGKERKSLTLRFGILEVLFLVLTVSVLSYYSLNTTFGDLDGFDSTFYLNLITNNVGLKELNSRNVFFGDTSFSFRMEVYSFQSYHYLASALIFTVEKLCEIFRLPFYRTPCFVWPNQILFFALTASLVIDGIKRVKEKTVGLIVLSIVMVVFYYGRFYFNNVFGFYGNSLRTLLYGQACCYIVDFEADGNKHNRYLFYMALLAACASSSTGIFSMYFFLFALYFLWIEKNRNLVKEFAVVLLLPNIDVMALLFGSIPKGIALGIAISAVIWLLNSPLNRLGSDRQIRIATICLFTIIMFAMSYWVDGNIFHYSAFVENNSQINDMTINYFYYPPEAILGIKPYKYIVLCIILLSVVTLRNTLTNADLILIVTLFNPFCCAYLNRIVSVYYRSYDILINPFTITYLLNMLTQLSSAKYAKEFGTILLSVYLLGLAGLERPIYYHKSFVPQDGYNSIYRMSQEELDVIDTLKNEMSFYGDSNPIIITHNKLTQSMLKEGEFLYGRENVKNETWSKAEEELYSIFYPVIFYGDPAQPEADYDHMCDYLKEADVRYVVQDKKIEYYDKEQGIWYSLTYVIDHCGEYPVFENDRYTVYRFGGEK